MVVGFLGEAAWQLTPSVRKPSPRSGLVQLAVERMAGPPRWFGIRELLEGQPSLTFAFGVRHHDRYLPGLAPSERHSSMRKWFRSALTTALVISAIAGAAWLAAHNTSAHPVYHGKPLSFWLQGFDNAPGAVLRKGQILRSDAKEAIRNIGTNAIPVLLGRLEAKDSSLKLKLIGLVQRPHWIKINYVTVPQRNKEARDAFFVLGASASNAVPELVRIYRRSDSLFTQAAILDSLAHIGPAAKGAIPLILQVAATNTDNLVWERGLSALGEIHAEPEIVVPALTKLLHDSRARARYIAAEDLSAFGAAGRVATADLLELLRDQDSSVCATALQTLGQIYAIPGRDHQWNHLVWSAKRIGYQPSTLITAINDLAITGTNAAPAVPALVKLLADPDEDLRASAAAALKTIDPENAAQIGVQ
jgi:HEAT repeat protein